MTNDDDEKLHPELKALKQHHEAEKEALRIELLKLAARRKRETADNMARRRGMK